MAIQLELIGWTELILAGGPLQPNGWIGQPLAGLDNACYSWMAWCLLQLDGWMCCSSPANYYQPNRLASLKPCDSFSFALSHPEVVNHPQSPALPASRPWFRFESPEPACVSVPPDPRLTVALALLVSCRHHGVRRPRFTAARPPRVAAAPPPPWSSPWRAA